MPSKPCKFGAVIFLCHCDTGVFTVLYFRKSAKPVKIANLILVCHKNVLLLVYSGCTCKYIQGVTNFQNRCKDFEIFAFYPRFH